TLSGTVSLTGATNTMNVAAGGDTLTVSGVVSGAVAKDLSKTGPGTLVLSAANTYSGATDIAAGTLRASNATSLGNTTGSTTIESGATLELNGNITVAENVVINGGTLAGVSTPTLSGTVNLTGTGGTLATAGGGDVLTITGTTSDAGAQ